ncbi:PiggyBac transposable element-derived protein 3 [Trichinella zimbabwensis]|uniref:PiggyBac transposable element-derived protein 3 n=1 Tax=Trichinella zimbabwensis TaxID=268475 RepID=A0A0V1GTF9_9BILA|nr:PiggyBac transposable element-derived protein 3 [Trichinella zimbabwensis]KRZ01385.1 PiggyBac transposable element-derived protein 3 [Trichinella zimbabwensis]
MENPTKDEAEASTSQDASTSLSVVNKDSLEGRRCERVKTLEEAKDAITISNQVINVVVLPPTAADSGSDDSDPEYLPNDPEDEFDPAGELEVEEELDVEEVEDIKLSCKEKRTLPRWKKSEDLDMIFPVEQLQPKENLQHLASLTPLAVWSKVFTDEMIDHITFQSNLYAHRECNNRAFTVSQHEIRQFIGLILLSGYNCLPEARHYWSTQPDMGAQVAISSMSRNWFMEIKKYLHLADNQKLVKGDKMSKVTPLYKLLNSSLIQHGMFYEKHSVDESIVPYFGRHGAKMFVKGKPIRNPRFESGIEHRSLTYQLLVKLAGLKMRAIGTIRPYRSNGADAVMLPDNQLIKQKRGAFDFRSDGNIYIVKWNDNAIVKIVSNFMTHSPLRSMQRRVKSQRIGVPMTNIVRSYNIGMGGSDHLDRLAAAYRPSIRGKKWYWPLFVNAVNVATVAAWRIHCFVEERPLSHLEFRRQVVLSLLQSERTAPPRAASGLMSQLPDIRFDGANHILGTGPQGRCKSGASSALKFTTVRNKFNHKSLYVEVLPPITKIYVL